MKKEFMEPEVEIVEFELEEPIADKIVSPSGWIIDTENEWN